MFITTRYQFRVNILPEVSVRVVVENDHAHVADAALSPRHQHAPPAVNVSTALAACGLAKLGTDGAAVAALLSGDDLSVRALPSMPVTIDVADGREGVSVGQPVREATPADSPSNPPSDSNGGGGVVGGGDRSDQSGNGDGEGNGDEEEGGNSGGSDDVGDGDGHESDDSVHGSSNNNGEENHEEAGQPTAEREMPSGVGSATHTATNTAAVDPPAQPTPDSLASAAQNTDLASRDDVGGATTSSGVDAGGVGRGSGNTAPVPVDVPRPQSEASSQQPRPDSARRPPSAASMANKKSARLHFKRVLGRGATGKVYLAELSRGGLSEPVAVKQLIGRNSTSAGVAKMLRLEAAMLSRLDHPHVIKYRGLHYSKTRRQYSLLMECVRRWLQCVVACRSSSCVRVYCVQVRCLRDDGSTHQGQSNRSAGVQSCAVIGAAASWRGVLALTADHPPCTLSVC